MKAHIDIEELRRGGVVELKGDDQFALWVKSACCNLNSRQLRGLADVADKYGRGLILFTTRQIPMVPFVHLGDVPAAKKDLKEVELELDRCGPRVRNLNVCYEDTICSEAVVNCLSLGQKLENFFGNPILHKVKIGVAGCRRDCIASRVLTDLGFVGVKNEGGQGFYDVYIGGRLGLNPLVGLKLGTNLSENSAVNFTRNYFTLLERESKPGERAADLVKRLGPDRMKVELNRDLDRELNLPPIECGNRITGDRKDRTIVRIRATNGEVTSEQMRQIAGVAENFGSGFVHFAVRGAPEIPAVAKSDLGLVEQSLKRVDLEIIDGGIDNLQTCFGGYCTEGIVDTQALLRQIEKKVAEPGMDYPDFTISASGCPNSCGIPQLSDIGFHGVLEPEVRPDRCTGCGLCVPICKRRAIEIVNGTAVIDAEKCGYCGQCVFTCPTDGVIERRRGFAVLAGGRIGENLRLGLTIKQFASAEEALAIAEAALKLAIERGRTPAAIIDEVGLEQFKDLLLARTEGVPYSDVKRR